MKVIGVIVSNLQNPFFAETALAIEAEARRHRYQISLAATNFSPELLRSAVQQMLGSRMTGLAVMTSERDDEAFKAILDSGINSVFLDVGRSSPTSTNIRVDTRGGMMAAVQHLIDIGHRDILFVRNSQKECGPPLLSHRYRNQGFAAAIKSCNALGVRANVVDVSGPGADAGLEAMSLVLGKIPFTAIIAITDMVAMGVYRGLQARGLSIPRDVSVVSFDNTYISRFLNPPLTTIDISKDELSRLAINALLSNRRANHSVRSLKLATRLVMRESTAAPFVKSRTMRLKSACWKAKAEAE